MIVTDGVVLGLAEPAVRGIGQLAVADRAAFFQREIAYVMGFVGAMDFLRVVRLSIVGASLFGRAEDGNPMRSNRGRRSGSGARHKSINRLSIASSWQTEQAKFLP